MPPDDPAILNKLGARVAYASILPLREGASWLCGYRQEGDIAAPLSTSAGLHPFQNSLPEEWTEFILVEHHT